MASKVPKTIVLKGHGIRKEYKAGSTLKPGSMCHLDTVAGTVTAANVRASSLHPPRRMIVVENDIEGKGVLDVYESGDNVLVEHLVPGQEVMLRAANTANLATGAAAAPDGSLIVAGTTTKIPDLYVVENYGDDTANSPAVDTDEEFVHCIVA